MIDYKNWLAQLQKEYKNSAKTSVESVKKFASTYKKVIGTSLWVATLLTTTGIHIDSVEAADLSKHSLETLYHIYVDGDRVGAVDDEKRVQKVQNKVINEYQENYEDLKLIIGVDVEVVPEYVFNSKTNNASTLLELENRLSVKAEAVALIVNGEEVGYVKSEQDYQDVIKKLKLQYVTEEELTKVLEAKESNLTLDEPSIGENLISDVRFSKQIENAKTSVNPNNILSVEEAIRQLNLGTLEDDIYVVEPGDVLGTIAEAQGLTAQEVLSLNTNITENTLLQVGAELNVTVYKPIVTVIVEEAIKIQEEIPFKKEINDDANMWRGETKIQQEGQNGERVVSYSITRENGTTLKKDIVNEKIIKEPVTQVVVKGTKVSSSRGTGKLAWPAVGGYISSYQGSRWGKQHKGIDIARPSNRNILAADNGTVAFAGWDGGYGNKIIINHNNGMRTIYAHLSSIDVNVGQTVNQGRKIGVMGTTGNSTGIHLHFEVYQSGNLKNPMDYFNR